MTTVTVHTTGEPETVDLGRRLGEILRPGDVVALYGELGAGKTTITKGIALGAGVEAEVSSPTFTLIHEHRGRILFYHVDLYRIESPEMVPDLGLEEYLYGPGVTVIEWAERLANLLPKTAIQVRLTAGGDSERAIEITAPSARWADAIQELTRYADSRA